MSAEATVILNWQQVSYSMMEKKKLIRRKLTFLYSGDNFWGIFVIITMIFH